MNQYTKMWLRKYARNNGYRWLFHIFCWLAKTLLLHIRYDKSLAAQLKQRCRNIFGPFLMVWNDKKSNCNSLLPATILAIIIYICRYPVIGGHYSGMFIFGSYSYRKEGSGRVCMRAFSANVARHNRGPNWKVPKLNFNMIMVGRKI